MKYRAAGLLVLFINYYSSIITPRLNIFDCSSKFFCEVISHLFYLSLTSSKEAYSGDLKGRVPLSSGGSKAASAPKSAQCATKVKHGKCGGFFIHIIKNVHKALKFFQKRILFHRRPSQATSVP